MSSPSRRKGSCDDSRSEPRDSALRRYAAQRPQLCPRPVPSVALVLLVPSVALVLLVPSVALVLLVHSVALVLLVHSVALVLLVPSVVLVIIASDWDRVHSKHLYMLLVLG